MLALLLYFSFLLLLFVWVKKPAYTSVGDGMCWQPAAPAHYNCNEWSCSIASRRLYLARRSD
jgi:hypothetical protein